MQNKNFFSKLPRNLPQFHFRLTRTKLFLFGVTLIAFGFALGGLESGGDETSTNKIVGLNLPERHDFQTPPADAMPVASVNTGTTGIPAQPEQWENVTVKPGQSLDSIFRQQGFSAQTLHRIMTLNEETKQL
jgi:hypothetical protein